MTRPLYCVVETSKPRPVQILAQIVKTTSGGELLKTEVLVCTLTKDLSKFYQLMQVDELAQHVRRVI